VPQRSLKEVMKRLNDSFNDIRTFPLRKVRRLVESLKSYIDKDWATLEKDFLNYYDANRHDTRFILHDLKELTSNWKHRIVKSLADWKKYERQFITIAGWLHAQETISDKEQDAYFLKRPSFVSQSTISND